MKLGNVIAALVTMVVVAFISYNVGYNNAVDEYAAQMQQRQLAYDQAVEALRTPEAVTPAATQTPKPTVTPKPAFDPDDKDDVIYLQRRLNTLGFSAGEVDGIFGPKTRSAVKDFQKAAGLERTGEVDEETFNRLISAFAPRITPKPTKTPKPTQKPTQKTEVDVVWVWITQTGECYHRKKYCGNTKVSWQVTLDEALDDGYRKCKNCY